MQPTSWTGTHGRHHLTDRAEHLGELVCRNGAKARRSHSITGAAFNDRVVTGGKLTYDSFLGSSTMSITIGVRLDPMPAVTGSHACGTGSTQSSGGSIFASMPACSASR
jgi:hypothetical protein